VTGHPVWLTRLVYHVTLDGEEAWKHSLYAKGVTLPVPPFVGLGVIVDKGSDPAEIDAVFVNEAGAVVCSLPHCREDDESCPPDEWPEYRAWLTAGWTRVAKNDPLGYRLPPAAAG
jgi:hypothetical protein